MSDTPLKTDPYKGVRDFFPEEAAVQQYIFSTWSRTAETFGFARYNASVLEPAELYKAKGAENEELVHDQTYTFTDRGDREVTLRPEMTPTVARLIAAKRRELSFPVRWYSIPNLFRYERPQRGRLREHWQLNCDIFGGDKTANDIEAVLLAQQTLLDFGADPQTFEIRLNHRVVLQNLLARYHITDITEATRLIDRIDKLPADEFKEKLSSLAPSDAVTPLYQYLTSCDESKFADIAADSNLSAVLTGLRSLGITNIVFSPALARGFDYYTGVIFELFDTSPENKRSLIGGGRYDNLTALFGGDAISGVGFGVGDVTMQDFLETHQLLTADHIQPVAPVHLIPMSPEEYLPAQAVAMEIRQAGLAVAVNTGSKKVGEKISKASQGGADYIIVIGEDEVKNNTYTLKHLPTGKEHTGPLVDLIKIMTIA